MGESTAVTWNLIKMTQLPFPCQPHLSVHSKNDAHPCREPLKENVRDLVEHLSATSSPEISTRLVLDFIQQTSQCLVLQLLGISSAIA